ncbi:MAG: ATPase P [Chloroflexota bacterium]|nr:ATPase P [Chloroflexota bacterium]
MIEIAVPGFGQLRLEHAVFDVNGTLAVDGQPDPEIGPRLSELAGHLQIHLLSALTHGNRAALEQAFGQAVHTIEPGDEAEQKAEYVRQLGADGCAAIGNGRNDRLMLAVAEVGIALIDL